MVLFSALLFFSVVAQADIHLEVSSAEKISPGESFSAQLLFSGEDRPAQFKRAYNGKPLLGSFFLVNTEIQDENTAWANLVYLKPLPPAPYILPDGKEIQIPQASQFLAVEAQLPQDFHLGVEQDPQWDLSLLKYFLISVLCFLGFIAAKIFLLFRIKKLKRVRKKKQAQRRKEKESFLLSPKKREDFENLFSFRRDFIEGFSSPKSWEEFFSVLNRHQFKAQWDERTLNEVQEAYKKIAGEIKGGT